MGPKWTDSSCKIVATAFLLAMLPSPTVTCENCVACDNCDYGVGPCEQTFGTIKICMDLLAENGELSVSAATAATSLPWRQPRL